MSSPARGERDAGRERAHLVAGCALGAACVALLGVRRRYTAEIPHARLVTYRTGGHAWVGHDAELFAEVSAFLKET